MKYIFFLSGDYIDIAKEEVLSLFEIKKSRLHGQILIVDSDDKDIAEKVVRLALTKKAYKVLFESDINKLKKNIGLFDWNSVYKESFCVRITASSKIKYSERTLAGLIWDRLNKPKVKLESPKTLVEFFFIKDNVYSTLLVSEVREGFESRKPHKRPYPHPGSMHPKLARAILNLSGAEKGDIVLDPFCGTGGFLIESGLIGIKSIGYDISRNMAEGCKANLLHFGIKNSKVKIRNALRTDDKFDYVITDLPYGLNSNLYLNLKTGTLKDKENKINLKHSKNDQLKNMENFYLEFLKKINGKCKCAVIIFPSFVDYKNIIRQSGFVLDKVFSIYVHRSLSRKIARIK